MELLDLVNSVTTLFTSSDLTQMVNYPTSLPDCNSPILALLDLFISSNPGIFPAVVFPVLGNFYHVVVSFSIEFPSNSNGDAPFHCTTYGYFYAD